MHNSKPWDWLHRLQKVFPSAHGMGHGTAASTALAMNTSPEIIDGSTGDGFAETDVSATSMILGCFC